MTLWLVGQYYDDFSDGGFDIRAVCTSEEQAKAFAEKSWRLGVKKCESNIFYADGIHFEE